MASDLFTLHEIQTRYIPRRDLGILTPAAMTAVATPQGAADLALRYLHGQEVEHVIAILLSGGLHTLCLSLISKGTGDSALCMPRDVFREAVRHNAMGIILAHNHPSGAPARPSQPDLDITKRLKEAGELLGITLHDHIITADVGRPFSFREAGLL